METVDINPTDRNETSNKGSSLAESKTSEALTRSPSSKRSGGLSQSTRRQGTDPNAVDSDAAAVSRAASNVLVSGMNLTRDLSRSIRSQLPAEVGGEEKPAVDENAADVKITIAASCSICLEEKPLYYLLQCQHAFCRECLSDYLETAIVSADLPVHCPQIGCGKEIDDTDVEKLVSEPIYTKFTRFMIKLQTPEVRECPKCDHLCKPSEESKVDDSATLVKCPKCKTVFCMVHSNAHPPDVSCESYEKVLKKMGGQQTEKLLKGMKRCPSCGVPTERTSGCPMMTCVNCSSNWCYVCGGKVEGSSEFSLRCTRCGANAFREHSDPTCLSCCCGAMCFPCWFTCGMLYTVCCCACCLCLEGCSCNCYISTCFWFEAAREWFWCPWMLCMKSGQDIWKSKNEKEWNQRIYNDNKEVNADSSLNI